MPLGLSFLLCKIDEWDWRGCPPCSALLVPHSVTLRESLQAWEPQEACVHAYVPLGGAAVSEACVHAYVPLGGAAVSEACVHAYVPLGGAAVSELLFHPLGQPVAHLVLPGMGPGGRPRRSPG